MQNKSINVKIMIQHKTSLNHGYCMIFLSLNLVPNIPKNIHSHIKTKEQISIHRKNL